MGTEVRLYPGVPPVAAFAKVDGSGTPIVIDSTGGTAYYLSPAGVVTALSGGSSGTSGTYSPTYTNIANCSAFSPDNPIQYTRVGSMVTVAGRVDITPTSSGLNTACRFPLPIPSVIGATTDLHGVAGCSSVNQAGVVAGHVASSGAQLIFFSVTTSACPIWFVFMYEVK